MAWLERQGLWPALAADACPIRRVHVSHRGRFGATRMSAAEHGVDALGHVVENRAVLAALDARLGASGVQRLSARRVDEVSVTQGGVRLRHLPAVGGAQEEGAVLRARLVIGVDGVDSAVRAALGIASRRVDYHQSAVLGTLAVERDHEHVAYERFTDTGPLALLPRPGRVVSFVECVTHERGEEVMALDEAAALAHLQRRFGYRLGRFPALGPRTFVPLARVEARRQVAPRAVLLGNAARLLHPIAGQGYNLALRDAARLVETLVPAGDPGEAARLAAFAAARRRDQRRVVLLTDTLARTFRGENAALSQLRALALVGLDTVSPLRRRFARLAMGAGD